MSPFKQALGNAKLALLSLFIALILSFLLNIFLGVMLFSVPKKMTVFIPPQIPTGGFEAKANQISNSDVYDFVYSLWTGLMTWSSNGESALPSNIKKVSPYLTNPFRNTLTGEVAQMSKQGFLYHHSQVTFGVNGPAYNPQEVKYIGHGTWLVKLEVRTVNYVLSPKANAGFGASHVASDAETSFVFKVVRHPVIKGYNYRGLALAGFAITPKVIKIYQ